MIKKDEELEDYAGSRCWVGLDLSSGGDFCASVKTRGWGACKCQRGPNCSEDYNEEDLKELIENVIKELKGEENEDQSQGL